MIAAAASTQPWWGIPAFTLAGAVLGAVLTQVFNLLNSRRQFRHQEVTAAQSLRRDTLAGLISAAHSYMSKSTTDEEAAAGTEFYSARVNFRLIIGNDDLLDAAEDYARAVSALAEHLRGDEGQDSPTLVQRCFDSEARLIAGARTAAGLFGLPAAS